MNSEVIALLEWTQTTEGFAKVLQNLFQKHHLKNLWMWTSSLAAGLDRLVEEDQQQGSYKLIRKDVASTLIWSDSI